MGEPDQVEEVEIDHYKDLVEGTDEVTSELIPEDYGDLEVLARIQNMSAGCINSKVNKLIDFLIEKHTN